MMGPRCARAEPVRHTWRADAVVAVDRPGKVGTSAVLGLFPGLPFQRTADGDCAPWGKPGQGLQARTTSFAASGRSGKTVHRSRSKSTGQLAEVDPAFEHFRCRVVIPRAGKPDMQTKAVLASPCHGHGPRLLYNRAPPAP